MPEKKKNPRRQNYGMWLALLVVLLIMILPIPIWARLMILLVVVAGFMYIRRSIIYFMMANRKLIGNPKKGKMPEPDKAWPLYKKAVDCGIAPNYGAIIGSTFIQRDDAEYGKQVLEQVIAKVPGTDLCNSAKVAMSMAYWRLGRLDKAIETLEEVKETGYVDKNLYINLGTYLMEAGEYKKAKKVLDEAKKLGPESPGITDNKGWYYLVMGEWHNAKKLYEELTEERTPKFPEAYLHGAQVKLHDGDIGGAVSLLERALQQRFVLTAGVTPEVLEDMLTKLQDPKTRDAAAAIMNANVKLVAAGGTPPWNEPVQVVEVVIEQHKPDNKKKKEQVIVEIEGPTDEELGLVCDDYQEDDDIDFCITEDDEREHSTDLTESDFLDDEDFDDEEEDSFYDLDDEDEREHCTDLDEEDDMYDDDEEDRK